MTDFKAKPTVYVVHCIDTEGPLQESLAQLFNRLKLMFGLDLPPTAENLRKLQAEELDIGGREREVAKALNPQFLNYMDSWPKLENMLAQIMSPSFRNRFADDNGKGWIYNWFCVDHVDYDENPHGRDIGTNAIYDRYRSAISKFGGAEDSVEFHFHPHPFNRRANSNATHWFSSTPKLFKILAERILDREWFPSCNRPGFHVERPDSHWFLEQFIPFDYASQAIARPGGEQADVAGGRFGDWGRAPKSWQPYHPSHDDHQVPGNCRRSIFRCLNVGTRFRCLEQDDVNQCFQEAEEFGHAVLAFADHDFRDMAPDVEAVAKMLELARREYPGVAVQNSDSRSAARAVLGLRPNQSFAIDLKLVDKKVSFEASSDVFGPQPFLAIKTVDGKFFHDALDIHVPHRKWSYVFDEHTLPLDRIESFGVAGNDSAGSVAISKFVVAGRKATQKLL